LAELKAPPDECLFIDDREKIVAIAASLGIHSIRFENSENLKRSLLEYGIEVK
jgi:FMN phosphatase YigB (HAD superfamily)